MRRDGPMAIAALGSSVLLWMVVRTNDLPQELPMSLTVPLLITQLSQDRYAVVKREAIIAFSLTGDQTRISAARRAGISAIVDLSDPQPGTSAYPVRLLPEWMEDRLVGGPLMTRITLEPVDRKRLPVTIDTSGRLKDDNLALSDSPHMPEEVTISGGRSVVARVIRAVATLDLSEINVNAPKATSVPIRLLNADGEITSEDVVTASPRIVLVTPVLSLAPGERTVVISPVFRGSPAAGSLPNGYRLSPEQVTLRGDSTTLSQVSKVFTEPIEIGGASSDVTVRARLRLPAGTRVTEGSSIIRATYLVKRNPVLPRRRPAPVQRLPDDSTPLPTTPPPTTPGDIPPL